MKRLIKLLFGDPINRKDLLAAESIGYRLVNITFFLTSLAIFYVIFRFMNLKVYQKNIGLSLLMTLNGISFLVFSIIALRYSKIVLHFSSLLELEKAKKSFWLKCFFIVGIPYLGMTLWMYLDNDIKSSFEMLAICVGTMILVYYFDWKKFLKSKSRFSDFFNL